MIMYGFGLFDSGDIGDVRFFLSRILLSFGDIMKLFLLICWVESWVFMVFLYV